MYEVLFFIDKEHMYWYYKSDIIW